MSGPSPQGNAEEETCLIEKASRVGVALEPKAARELLLLRERVLAAPLNLTSIRDKGDFLHLHILDSLTAVLYLTGLEGPVVDIGSGGGFPMLPLAIARPDLAFLACESDRKKARFIEEAAHLLGLSDRVRVATERAETLGRNPEHRERYGAATARAIGELSTVAELALPLLRKEGRLVAYRARAAHEEAAAASGALKDLGSALEEVVRVTIPDRPDIRHLILIRKTAPTPDRFPRRPGIPQKRPLQ